MVLSESKGGHIPGAFDLTTVFGFSSSDIYAAGERLRTNPNPPPNFIDSSLIIHYDGTAWRKVNVYKGRLVGDIYGISQSNIWAGGWGKAMYHYNGNSWETDSIEVSVPLGYFFQVSSISSYNSIMYLIASLSMTILV